MSIDYIGSCKSNYHTITTRQSIGQQQNSYYNSYNIMTLHSANFTFIKSVLFLVHYRASTCHESPPKSDVGHFHEELMKKEAATERRIIRKCLYEADAIKIVGAFLQCSQTDLQVIIADIFATITLLQFFWWGLCYSFFLFSVLCCVFCFVCLRSVSCIQCWLCLWIVHP